MCFGALSKCHEFSAFAVCFIVDVELSIEVSLVWLGFRVLHILEPSIPFSNALQFALYYLVLFFHVSSQGKLEATC